MDDVARLLVDLATKPWTAPPSHVYNVGTGVQTSLLDLVQALADALRTRGLDGEHLVPLVGPARSGDLDHSVADVTAIAADLGWRAEVDLTEGLSALVDATLQERLL